VVAIAYTRGGERQTTRVQLRSSDKYTCHFDADWGLECELKGMSSIKPVRPASCTGGSGLGPGQGIIDEIYRDEQETSVEEEDPIGLTRAEKSLGPARV
jgi:hypothetical protein